MWVFPMPLQMVVLDTGREDVGLPETLPGSSAHPCPWENPPQARIPGVGLAPWEQRQHKRRGPDPTSRLLGPC